MDYVDLGLSVKWANCNVGASTPEEYGSYFNYEEAKKAKDVVIPTIEQWKELQKKCKCSLDEERAGYIVTGKNGNSIYLPLAGEGKNSPDVHVMGAFFWSSDDTVVTGNPFTWFASFDIKGHKSWHLLDQKKYYISLRGVQLK